ncbi:hypothetical protein, partial [Parahaliea mediterranea]|uniref:hypothetical protein n=1 Tax=Parahaliea mediterranea TaxID=651086 RepID=UPI001F499545
KRYLSTGTFSMIRSFGVMHASRFEWAVPALQQSALKVSCGLACAAIAYTSKTECFSHWADTGHGHGIECEFACRNDIALLLLRFVLMAFAVFLLLTLETRISRPELVVRDVAVDLSIVQVFHVGFVGEAGVCGNDGLLVK